jgi:hypothetical protein
MSPVNLNSAFSLAPARDLTLGSNLHSGERVGVRGRCVATTTGCPIICESFQSLRELTEPTTQPECFVKSTGLRDHNQDSLQIVSNVIVQGSYHVPSQGANFRLATFVIVASVRMAVTIDLNSESLLRTSEVDRVPIDGILSPKLQSAQSAISKSEPESAF